MLVALLFRNSMGWGDVKMAGLIGLMTGFPGVLVALLGGTVLGGVIATVLLVARHKSRKDAIPFGPFLALGALLGLFWGGPLVEWYLSFFR
jgi:leader peptidase (prepilin peptidase)/N-methyltransferase